MAYPNPSRAIDVGAILASLAISAQQIMRKSKGFWFQKWVLKTPAKVPPLDMAYTVFAKISIFSFLDGN